MREIRRDEHAGAGAQESRIGKLLMEFVILGLKRGKINILLEKHLPGSGASEWVLPTGAFSCGQTLDNSAMSIVQNVTGVKPSYLDQIKTIGRVPHGDTVYISIGHLAMIREDDFDTVMAHSVNRYQWWPVGNSPNLALNNDEMLALVISQLRAKIKYEPISFCMLPTKFTLLQLQEVYEGVLDVKVDKPNFRRKVMNLNLLEPCNEKEQNVSHRAASLYRFNKNLYDLAVQKGFYFQL